MSGTQKRRGLESNGNHQSRTALVVAHPSHELRVHGWMQQSCPLVFVITDGSGRSKQPRLLSTTKVLNDLGAQRGSIYGQATDLEVYDAFLKQDFAFFIRIAEQLAKQFIQHQIEFVVADSAEGYSPTHDACRLLTDAAAEIVRRKHQQEIASFDFAVVGPPDECPEQIREQALWINLDEGSFQRKVAAVRSYDPRLALDVESALGGELFNGVKRLSQAHLAGVVDIDLSNQVVAALNGHPEIEEKFISAFQGIELNRFRTECLRPVSARGSKQPARQETPFYEIYGETLVAAGRYSRPIRYAENFLPLAEAVWHHVGAG